MVVVGILFALGIDSLWEGRQERALEHDLLTQLNEDLGRAETQLGRELRMTEEATEAALHLVAAAHGQRQAPSDSLAQWLVRVSWWSDPVPTTASAQALVSSNTLHIIQDDGLRSSVVAFLEQVAQLQVRIPRHEADLHEFLRSVDQLVSPLDRGVPLYVGVLDAGVEAQASTVLQATRHGGLQGIVTSSPFDQLALKIFYSHENLRWLQARIIAATRDLRAHIQAVLDRRATQHTVAAGAVGG